MCWATRGRIIGLAVCWAGLAAAALGPWRPLGAEASARGASEAPGGLHTTAVDDLSPQVAFPEPTSPPPRDPQAAESTSAGEPQTIVRRGRVVWLGEALKRRYGIEVDHDWLEAVVALETSAGELLPLAKDARGRGFHKDPRLMEFDLELVLRRFAGAPVAQVIQVYTLEGDKRLELDYWCDICAIPMYELKACECCQGETRLRFREVAGP